MKYILAIFSLILLLGCQGNINSPDENISTLTTSLDTTDMDVFSSKELGIQLHYPENWGVHGGDEVFIRIAEKENYFPWKDYSSIHPDYSIWIQTPYLSQTRKLFGTMSAAQVAKVTQNIARNDATEIVEPITSVTINGQDGATVLKNHSDLYIYSVFLSLDEDNTVVLSSWGQEESVEEMRSVLNAIALTVEPLSD